MKTSLNRVAFQPLLATLAFLLALSGSLFAQKTSLSALPTDPSEPESAGTVETASNEATPFAARNASISSAAPRMPASAVAMAPMALVSTTTEPKAPASHPFMDRKNKVLFSAVAGLATVDFFATRANLNSGGKELNPMTRVFAGSTPALATNFALEASGVIGLSYVFHKTGHHKLERITAIVNIGSSATAAGYSLSHR